MKIAFYSPMNPQDALHPSGDKSTADLLVAAFKHAQHQVVIPTTFRAWNCFQKTSKPKHIAAIRLKALERAAILQPDLWLTYHSYWKAPDIIGPWCCKKLNIPYIIYKGMHAEKRKRDNRSLPGYQLNKQAILQAEIIFADSESDIESLHNLIGSQKVHLVRAGIDTTLFKPCTTNGSSLQPALDERSSKKILTVASMREGVKTKSIKWLLQALSGIPVENNFHLVLVGDGPTRSELEQTAQALIPNQYTFMGQVHKKNLPAVYSAADIFCHPGFGESLGMVYLEAMACGLPVLAMDNCGSRQFIKHLETGLIGRSEDMNHYRTLLLKLMENQTLCSSLGVAARKRVSTAHDFSQTFKIVSEKISNYIIKYRN
ncbi:MAG: glycosyltransferase family 4 protein [Desulfovibrio sp.]